MWFANDTHKGDLLSGVIGTMTAWSNMQQKTKHSDSKSDETTTSNVDKSSLSSSTAAAKDAEEHEVYVHTAITTSITESTEVSVLPHLSVIAIRML
jgi:hypothetical protein